MRVPSWRGLVAGMAGLALLWAPTLAWAGSERLPDIKAMTPTDMSLEVSAEGQHLLRFTQAFVNVGAGPLRVIGLPTAQEGVMQGYQEILDEAGAVLRSHPISSVIFHPHHNHWHAGDIASYELRQGSPWGRLVAANGKVSFCLVDTEWYREHTGPYHAPGYFTCKDPTQGLSPGWVDIYEEHLYDQWVDVTDTPDGVYFLVVKGDPQHIYREADHGDWVNNTAWVKVELAEGATSVRLMLPNEALIRVAGERLHLPVHPRITDDRAVAHIRLAEHLGARVHWDGAKAIITKGSARVEVTPGQSIALANGTPVEMGTAAVVDEGRILVPVRFLAEQLGFRVGYDPLTATIDVHP